MDDSGTDLFESYELECQELASSLQSLLTELTESGVQGRTSLVTSSSADTHLTAEGKGKLSRVEAELVEMDEIVGAPSPSVTVLTTYVAGADGD